MQFGDDHCFFAGWLSKRWEEFYNQRYSADKESASICHARPNETLPGFYLYYGRLLSTCVELMFSLCGYLKCC